jgi:hypothetical protein
MGWPFGCARRLTLGFTPVRAGTAFACLSRRDVVEGFGVLEVAVDRVQLDVAQFVLGPTPRLPSTRLLDRITTTPTGYARKCAVSSKADEGCWEPLKGGSGDPTERLNQERRASPDSAAGERRARLVRADRGPCRSSQVKPQDARR